MGRKQTRGRKHLYLCLAAVMLLGSWSCAIPEKTRIGIHPETEIHQRLLHVKKLLAEKDFEGALRGTREILSLAAHQPPEDEALYISGMIYVYPENPGRDAAKALYFFDRVVRDFPGSPWAFQAAAWMETLQEMGRLRLRVDHLSRRVERLDLEAARLKQEKIKTEAVKEAPHPLLNSRDLISQGRYEEAAKAIHQALTLTSQSPGEDEALFQLGLIYAHQGNPRRDYGKSLGYFRRLIRDYPQSFWAEPAKTWMGMVQESERLNQTIEKLNQTLEKSKQVDIEIEEKKKEKGK